MAEATRGRRSGGGALRRLGLAVVLILLLGALGLVAGFAVGTKLASQYTAQATILVSPLSGNPFNPDGQGDNLVNLQTEAQLLDSDTVAASVLSTVGGTTTGQMLKGLSVDVPSNTQILSLTYTASSASVARARAQGFADAYLDFRTQRAQTVSSSRTGRIQGEINAQSRALDRLVQRLNLDRLVQRLNSAGPSVRRAVLQQQIDGATTQIGQLRTALAVLQTGGVDPGQVVTPAHGTSRSPAATRLLFSAGGLIVGVLLALLIVVLLGRRRHDQGSFDDDRRFDSGPGVYQDRVVAERVDAGRERELAGRQTRDEPAPAHDEPGLTRDEADRARSERFA